MRIPLVGIVLVLLSSCVSTYTTELWTGVHAKDQLEVCSALRALTNSSIRDWQLDYGTGTTEIIVYSWDGRAYRAKKIAGKWHVEDITDLPVVTSRSI
jgi:hypothetical protein